MEYFYYRTVTPLTDATSTAVAVATPVAQAVDALLKRTPTPSVDDLANLFKGLTPGSWSEAASRLAAAGISGDAIRSGIYQSLSGVINWTSGSLTMLAAALAGFHGIRRNGSIFWGALWFIAGMTWPVYTSIAAFAQGFGKRK